MAVMRRLRARTHGRDMPGQGTVELAVVMPVVLVIAVVGVNACTFFSECAAFDRIARQAVRVYATSPAYGEGAAAVREQVRQEIAQAFSRQNENVEVSVESVGSGCFLYQATLSYEATLFGMGLKQEIFGIELPELRHEVGLVVDPYDAGVSL